MPGTLGKRLIFRAFRTPPGSSRRRGPVLPPDIVRLGRSTPGSLRLERGAPSQDALRSQVETRSRVSSWILPWCPLATLFGGRRREGARTLRSPLSACPHQRTGTRMDNAGRRNIHARAACRESGMDRQAPTRDRNVKARPEIALPQPGGESGRISLRSAKGAKMDAFSAALQPLPSSASGSPAAQPGTAPAASASPPRRGGCRPLSRPPSRRSSPPSQRSSQAPHRRLALCRGPRTVARSRTGRVRRCARAQRRAARIAAESVRLLSRSTTSCASLNISLSTGLETTHDPIGAVCPRCGSLLAL